VAVGLLRIYGQPIEYHKGIVNKEMPLLNGKVDEEVDKLLLEMGVPLLQPSSDWNFDPV